MGVLGVNDAAGERGGRVVETVFRSTSLGYIMGGHFFFSPTRDKPHKISADNMPIQGLVRIEPEWFDIRSAATYLSVSVAFLRKAVRLGRIPYARAGSKILRFRRADLDQWLMRNGNL